MAQGIKTMFKISKHLEQSFKLISFFSVRYLAKASKYKTQYLNEYKRATGKMSKDSKKKQMKQTKKFKQEKEQLLRKIQELKKRGGIKDKDDLLSEHRRDGRDRDRDREREHRRRSHSRDRHREKERQRRMRERGKGHHHGSRIRDGSRSRSRSRSRQKRRRDRSGSGEKRKDKKVIYPEDMPEKRSRPEDFLKEFEDNFNKLEKHKKKDKRVIFEEDESDKEEKKRPVTTINERHESAVVQKKGIRMQRAQEKQKKPDKSHEKWSQRQVLRIGSSDPNKYKILKLNEANSDFEDENAPVKVPQIRPREPLTPYFLFLREKRYFIAQSYPELPPENMSATIGRVWKNLPDEEKKPYIEQYERAGRIYAKKLKQYYAVHPKQVQAKQKIKMKIEEQAKRQRRGDRDRDRDRDSKKVDEDEKERRSKKEEGEGKKSRKKAEQKKKDDGLEQLNDHGL